MIDWRQIGQNYVDLRRDRDLRAADAQSTTRFFSNFRLFPVFVNLLDQYYHLVRRGQRSIEQFFFGTINIFLHISKKHCQGHIGPEALSLQTLLSALSQSTSFNILIKLQLGFVWQRARNTCNNFSKSM